MDISQNLKLSFKTKAYDKYKIIHKYQALKLSNAWLSNFVVKEQMKIVQPLLDNHKIPKVAKPVIDIINNLNLHETNILDIGCSGGYYYDFFKYGKVKNIKYQGCDYSPNFIKLANKLHHNLKFKIGNIENLPYQNNEFQVVLASAVLYYASNQEKAISELARVSSKYVILHRLPVFDCNHKSIYVCKTWYGTILKEIIYNKNDLINIIKEEGFVVNKFIKHDLFDIKHLNIGNAHLTTILLSKNL